MFKAFVVASSLLFVISRAATFRGFVSVVDGKCNATDFVGRELFIEDGSLSLNDPCQRLLCDTDSGEIEGMSCPMLSCPEGCTKEAKDPAGVYPLCCLSECRCPGEEQPQTISMSG